MAIDQARYERFERDLAQLREGVTIAQYLARVRSRLLSYISRQGVSATDLPVIRAYLREILPEELAPFVDQVTNSYTSTLDLINEHYADLGVTVTNEFPLVQAIETAARQELGQFEQDVLDALTRELRASGVERESITALKDRISDLESKASNSALTIARTQIMTVARAGSADQARLAGIGIFQYVGLRRGSNRAFCHVLVGQTHTITTIDQLRNGNREPVLLNCGGWNCIHKWEPDPFAKASDLTADDRLVTFLDGRRSIVLPGGESAQAAYESGSTA